MDNIRGLEKFDNDLSFAIDTAHKSIVWIDCFDFGYIKKLLDNLSSKSHQSYNIRYWSNSTGEIRNSSGDQRVKVKVNRKNERDLTVVTSIETVVSFSEALKWFVNTSKCTHLVLRVSENNLLEKEAVPTLQEFVCLNNENISGIRRTIILVAATHIEVPGLEHLCERLTLPLPDIKDIDFELGYVNTETISIRTINNETLYFKSDSDTFEILDSKKTVSLDKTEDLIGCIVDVDLQLKGKGFFSENLNEIVLNKGLGLVCRDSNGKVKIIITPQNNDNIKHPLSDDFDISYNGKIQCSTFKEKYEDVVNSFCGMHLYDIQRLLEDLKCDSALEGILGIVKRPIIEYTCGKPLPERIAKKKKQIVKNTGLLEVVDVDANYYEKVADIDGLIKDIDDQNKRIKNKSKYPSKFPQPKGILLVGAPGCGKSESAKAIASKFCLPLYRLNIDHLLGHKYGQSENRFSEALSTADASAPCVLWIDEIEKAFAGAGNESENDDTLTHIVGHFLTWMQEHQTMVYLVATANDLSKMKPEMLRKGRWDEIYTLSYPSSMGCKKILKAILIEKFGIELVNKEGNVVFEKDGNGKRVPIKDINNEELDKLTKKMFESNMSGAEIENIIIEVFVKKKSLNCNNEISIDEIMSHIKDKNQTDRSKFFKRNQEKDYFLCQKVYNELLDKRINLGLLKEKECGDKIIALETLLFEKYQDQYEFKSASNPNF